jgi:hypothetical protein
MFFPGVVAEPEAKIITVKNYEQLKVEDFRLLPPLKVRWFSGVVLSADKTPFAGAIVSLVDAERNNCSNFHSEIKTDESGRFRLQGYESYRYQIRAYTDRKTGLYSKPLQIPPDGAAEEIQLILDSTY